MYGTMHTNPDWLQDPHLQALFAATEAVGGQARAIGGCVRDHLLGREIGDVDIASSLAPEHTIAIAQQHRWKAIPTGMAHGTVTLVLPSRVVEVTTLRRDVTTLDAGARLDPLVRGVDHRLEFGVRQDALGQIAAGARDA